MTIVSANWYPDPAGQHELRFYDGTQWTDHVSTRGVASLGPIVVAASNAPAETATGGGSLFSEPVLVVTKAVGGRPRRFEIATQGGVPVGIVDTVGEGGLRRTIRRFTKLGPLLKYRIVVTDPLGATVLKLTRPPSMWKMKIRVTDAAGNLLGGIEQENAFTRSYKLILRGQPVARVHTTSVTSREIQIDVNGYPVCNVTRSTSATINTAFTTANQYVVRFHHPLDPAVHTLVVATTLASETLLRPKYG